MISFDDVLAGTRSQVRRWDTRGDAAREALISSPAEQQQQQPLPPAAEPRRTGAHSDAHWMADRYCKVCYSCGSMFTLVNRRHHCRICGQIFCHPCTSHTYEGARVCDHCHTEQTVSESGAVALQAQLRLVRNRAAGRPAAAAAAAAAASAAAAAGGAGKAPTAALPPPRPFGGGTARSTSTDRGGGAGSAGLAGGIGSPGGLGGSGAPPTSSIATAEAAWAAETAMGIGGGGLRAAPRQQLTRADLVAELEAAESARAANAAAAAAAAAVVAATSGGREGHREGQGAAVGKLFGRPALPPRPSVLNPWLDPAEQTVAAKLRALARSRVQYLVRRMLLEEKAHIPTARRHLWEAEAVELACRAATAVTPQVHCGDRINISAFVNIKAVPGGEVSECRFVNGVVARQRAASRACCSHASPRVLLLACGLQWARDKVALCSFDTLLEQEQRYTEMLVQRIMLLRPTVIITARATSSTAQVTN